MHKTPARLTHLGKIWASRQTKRFGQKLGIYAKDYTLNKLKTRKGDLGKNGYPGGLKTRKGGPYKN